MNVRRDLGADAAYIEYQRGEIVRTEELADGTIVDVGMDGSLVGFEVLSISRGWNPTLLASRFDLTATDVATILALTVESTVAVGGRSATTITAAEPHAYTVSGAAELVDMR